MCTQVLIGSKTERVHFLAEKDRENSGRMEDRHNVFLTHDLFARESVNKWEDCPALLS